MKDGQPDVERIVGLLPSSPVLGILALLLAGGSAGLWLISAGSDARLLALPLASMAATCVVSIVWRRLNAQHQLAIRRNAAAKRTLELTISIRRVLCESKAGLTVGRLALLTGATEPAVVSGLAALHDDGLIEEYLDERTGDFHYQIIPATAEDRGHVPLASRRHEEEA